jgi:pyruvate dehydrogenase E2 component (dihydrolipoamide acetyltransferase)
LPDLGEGIHEGEILAVLVSLGDEIKEGDPILEVETDKASVEIPSPYNGKVIEILVEAGSTVKVGDVMMKFSGDEAEKEPPPEKEVSAVIEAQPPETSAPRVEALPEAPSPAGPVPASPSTRKLARKLGIDLLQVPASGPGGRVTAEDVQRFSQKGIAVSEKKEPTVEAAPGEAAPAGPVAVPPLPDFTKWGEIERVPFRSIRRATARQMSLAWAQIPHVNSQDAVDLTKLEAFRQRHKKDIEAKGGRLTLSVFALKAVATALKTYPQFNATLDTAADEIIVKKYFHIGMAVNTQDGLIVPVVKDVDRKSITELAVELYDLVTRTRERKVKLDELKGGTFTITNVGSVGKGGFFAPIINYPEVAILGMGSTAMKPVAKENENGDWLILARLMLPVVLCIDHRVLDGADAVRFLGMVKEALEDPDELLMTMI